MVYKIALASSDGQSIDQSFGMAEKFRIYQVAEGAYEKIEDRAVKQEKVEPDDRRGTVLDNHKHSENCETGSGCGGERSGGCGQGKVSPKVELLSDCRCIVCRKIGFPIQKQLETKQIASFDVDCSVEEALHKITNYYLRVDHHKSLWGQDKNH